MQYYKQNANEILKNLETSMEGLTEEEAAARLVRGGKNTLKQEKKTSFLNRFLSQLTDPMIVILLAAAGISAATSVRMGEPFTDVIIILSVVIINAILGVYQESKAEAAIEALQKMSASTSTVIRGGHPTVIKSEDLVCGDVILLNAGDAVPADCRILSCTSLKAEESALTGESLPVNKTDAVLNASDEIPLGDRKNMLYMGSSVVYGHGKAVITKTGMDTEMGQIADALVTAGEGKTPLQKKLSQLSRILSILVMAICGFLFVFSLIRSGDYQPETILDTFLVAVSLAVAAIPEGLAAVVTVVLSVGVTNMSKKNAIIRKLTAVETLGCAEVICSDKTGTLTQNKMTVTEVFSQDEALLAVTVALASDAELDADGKAVGEPTECALVEFARDRGFVKNSGSEDFKREGEVPFDSARKMMSAVYRDYDRDGYIQYSKGAPDVILNKCTHILRDGKNVPLTVQLKEEILRRNQEMASRALRVLGAAVRTYHTKPSSFEPGMLEQNMTFVGLCGMMDPIRPEVREAIKKCRRAGIRPVMITGDHIDTAVAIAKSLGIAKSAAEAVTGIQLNKMSDGELSKKLEHYSIFARVGPEHKVRIVKAWRKKGRVTAMTGDGVNDAPSIKHADIGISMGIMGTDVTKKVADMVLADDNFATIVSAVEEGRRVYDNIRKAIQFLLASNMSEVLSIFFSSMMGFTILKPVQLLWINLITDCFPALALGVEKGEADLMERKPRRTKDGIFSGGLGFDVLYQGVLVTVLTLIAYGIGHYTEHGFFAFETSGVGMTMAFLTLSMAEIFHSFNMRSGRGSLFSMKSGNKMLWFAGITSLILTTAVIFYPPFAAAFGFTAIRFRDYVIALLLSVSVIPVVEIIKSIERKGN